MVIVSELIKGLNDVDLGPTKENLESLSNEYKAQNIIVI